MLAEGPHWSEVASEVLSRCGTAMAIGAPDSGKSTFLFWLAGVAARAGRRVWMVDADVGQSDIGPPTTIGAAPIPADLDGKPPSPLVPLSMQFVGSTSPRGNLLPMVTGTVRAVEDAQRQGGDLILVDTTGYVGEVAAVVLKISKIEAVRPDVVLAFGDAAPLAAILDPFRFMRHPRIIACPSTPAVRRRSQEQREAARLENWRGYFADAAPLELPLDRVGISGEGRSWLAENDIRGRVVGLYAPSGACRALGLVSRSDRDQMQVLTPLSADVPVVRIHIGRAEIAL